MDDILQLLLPLPSAGQLVLSFPLALLPSDGEEGRGRGWRVKQPAAQRKSLDYRMFYVQVVTHSASDLWGRFVPNPKSPKADLFPMTSRSLVKEDGVNRRYSYDRPGKTAIQK